jgi:uncharacterized repeat protein (TIGR03943 family)
MTTALSRWLPGVTLAAWSAILLHVYLSGRVADLLTPVFRPGVLIGGIVMAAMALLAFVRPPDPACCAESDCAHPLSRSSGGKVLTFLVLFVPIVAAAFFSKDEFSKNLMMNRGIITDLSTLPGSSQKVQRMLPPDLPLPSKDPAPGTVESMPPAPTAPGTAAQTPPAAAEAATNDYLQRTPDGFIVAEVLDLLYAAQDSALRKDFEGKPVQLIGQLMPDVTSNSSGNRFKAVRMFMTCCAADARPVATLVEANPMPSFPEMTWIKITGVATFPIENGKRMAVLKADRVDKTEPPEEMMLY